MNRSNPRMIAFVSALVAVVSLALVYSIASLWLSLFNWIVLVTIVSVSFIITYLWNYYSISRFIDDRIRLVYKNIRDTKKGKDYRPSWKMRNDVIGEVSREVEQWQAIQEQEIGRLKENERYRREFIGNISHELRNPINNIQGYVTTLLDGGVDDQEVNMKFLKRTAKSVDRMISIIDDLDAISKLESGELQMDIEEFDVREIAQEAISASEIYAEKREVSIFFRQHYSQPIMVQGDRYKLKQVFINLIDNSIKYGKYGGKTKVSFFDMDKNILVEITDDGEGIDQRDLPRIFERFFRTDRARTRQKRGSGLGLSIVKHILDAHKQTINARSTIGIGTTFAFTIRKAGF